MLDRVEILNNIQFKTLFNEAINISQNTIVNCSARIDWEQTKEFAEIRENSNEKQISITCENAEIVFTLQIIFCHNLSEELYTFNCVYMDFPDETLICDKNKCEWHNEISEVSMWNDKGEAIYGIPLKKYAPQLESIGKQISKLFDEICIHPECFTE